MQQMPSTTPDSRTISATSSVMSVTWRPPVVWKCRSAWKTFIGDESNEYFLDTGPVAQRLEQGTHNSLVPGSNPGGPSCTWQACLLAGGLSRSPDDETEDYSCRPGKASERRAHRARSLDPHEMTRTVDDFHPGVGNAVRRIRRCGERHRAQGAVDEADGDPDARQSRFECRQLREDRPPHVRPTFSRNPELGHRRCRRRIGEVRRPDVPQSLERQLFVGGALRGQLVELTCPLAH